MLSVEKARRAILDKVRPLGKEGVTIKHSAGRILREDVYSKSLIPPFDNSAMDGYAVRAVDLNGSSPSSPKVLRVIGRVKAGTSSRRAVSSGEAIRIMTGAPLPGGADSVVMVEHTNSVIGKCKCVEIYKEVKRGENVRYAGEDIKKGELILKKGTLIRPAEMGILASIGRDKVYVYKKPKIAFFVTGDELMGARGKLKEGKIRNTNTFTLYGQLVKYRAIPVDLGVIRDDVSAIKKAIERGARYDMIVSSGGVSVGDYDYLKDVFRSLGGKVIFWKVAMKPGKPFLFGMIKGVPLFGVPGNPVSSMITFEEFIAPAILKMTGRGKAGRMKVRAKLAESIYVSPKRSNYIRVHVVSKNGDYYASSTGPQGSAILKSMSRANGILTVLEGVGKIKKGSKVEVELLDHMGL